VTGFTNGSYAHEPLWYYNFLYEQERERGLDCEEDLVAPGVFSWNLSDGDAALVLTTSSHAATAFPSFVAPIQLVSRLREGERNRRAAFESPLHISADAYIVQRGQGKTIIAGYPWFTDWGRDTLIALRGLCLATGRLDVARDILLAWASAVSEGMLPNRFPDRGEQAEFNAVDASLWFVIAAYEFLEQAKKEPFPVSGLRQKLIAATETILEGYSKGTRFGIRADRDGLLAAGEQGVQLTWMDARVGDWVVTPRIGKPVEVQALWLNALWIGSRHDDRWRSLFDHAHASFQARFWNAERHCLYDVVDVHHRPGEVDPAVRPNQILAVGGLPLVLLNADQAQSVVQSAEDELLTPLGLRSLAPGESGYVGCYQGGVSQRDGSYHQGTAWPWLLGAFVEAWVRVHGNDERAKKEARQRFLVPLLLHLDEAGLGHISEIVDGDSPYTPRGCPFQAWSLGEALRLDRIVLRVQHNRTGKAVRKAPRSSKAQELIPA
jgi:predicted glycogen debranching enzyme